MKYYNNRITIQTMLFLSALLIGSAPVYSGSSKYLAGSLKYYKLPIFKNYSGEDAAYIFIAYKDNIRIGSSYEKFYDSGSSILILDGQRTRTKPSIYLKQLRVEPGKHSFKIQGKVVTNMNTTLVMIL